MIELNQEQINYCQKILNESDSVFDAQYDVLYYLGYDPYTIDSETRGKIFSFITNSNKNAAQSSRPANVEAMYALTESVAATYERKNADYGDSFGKSVTKYGVIAALTRMSDKWNRLENLILNDGKQLVAYESINDTLLDLATYALMTYIALNNTNKEEKN